MSILAFTMRTGSQPTALEDPHPRRVRVLALVTAAYAILMVLASGLPVIRGIERAGGGSATGWDKVLHVAAFSILGFLLCEVVFSLRGRPAYGWRLAVALGVGAVYATFHEGIQSVLPGFVFKPLDLLSDLAGLGVGSGTALAPRLVGIRRPPSEVALR